MGVGCGEAEVEAATDATADNCGDASPYDELRALRVGGAGLKGRPDVSIIFEARELTRRWHSGSLIAASTVSSTMSSSSELSFSSPDGVYSNTASHSQCAPEPMK